MTTTLIWHAKVVLSLVLVPFLITGGVTFARWLDARGAN